ncbi:hypothetical protein C8N46_101160 [Kordia periserrulae]|uniref:Uncharacterized protein n=1 Tax=Kordia periserrulae TaxID=701523 RepID=A0A2T6C5F7_9FLAO|nr:hypothetical protein C8N46_101160 [Kordia periserrulae]
MNEAVFKSISNVILSLTQNPITLISHCYEKPNQVRFDEDWTFKNSLVFK